MSAIGILVGGGPAPGINGVIGAATAAASRGGSRVIGILEGFRHIMNGNTGHVLELDEGIVDQIHLKGGSILHTSRANPSVEPEHLANCVKSLDALGIDQLITIGSQARGTAGAAKEAGLSDVQSCATIEEITALLSDAVKSGDLVLLKGSRTTGLEQVVDQLKDSLTMKS